MVTAGYCRVSSKEQAEDSNALEQQKLRVLSKGVELDWLFVDVQSGRTDKRPSYIQLKSLISQGIVKKVVVTRLDRLTRSVKETAKVVDFFLEHGCNLIALDDSIDLYSASGKFQVHMLGALSQMESDRLSERVKHGKAHERALGHYSGRVPFGYKIENRKLVLNTDLHSSGNSFADIARDAVDIYLSTRALHGAVIAINTKYGAIFRLKTSFRTWLINPILIGERRDKQGVLISCHEPLITLEKRESILSILALNKRKGGYGAVKNYALTSLIVCAECNRKMVRLYHSSTQSSKTYPVYYHCRKSQMLSCSNKKLIRSEKLEAAIIQTLNTKKVSLAEQVVASNVSRETSQKIAQLTTQIEQLKLIGDNPAILEAINRLKSEIDSLVEGSSRSQIAFVKRKEKLDLVMEDPTYWAGLSEIEKGDIFHALVRQVVVRDAQVESIDLNF